MAVTEVRLCKGTPQVLFTAVLVTALHAALEDREGTFNWDGVDKAAAIFALKVVDAFMAGEFPADRGVDI